MSESLPHLKRGCIRDFKTLLRGDELWNDDDYNATDCIYKIGKSEIEFFGVDNTSKVTGAARDILFMNEAIHIDFKIYQQLVTRTSWKVILDYNPLFDSWIDEKVLPNTSAKMIHSTYKDNEMLTAEQVREIEYQGSIDENYRIVFMEGRTGSYEGVVIKNWDIVPELPKIIKSQWIGIDFGWVKPAAVEHVVLSEGGEVFIDELAYEPGLDNAAIADVVKRAGLAHVLCVADSAEPKSIAELRKAGLNVEGADKKDIPFGIKVMNRYKKHYTTRSVGSIDENRRYTYKKDAIGNYTEYPVDAFNHAKDAERYVFEKYLSDAVTSFSFSIVSSRK